MPSPVISGLSPSGGPVGAQVQVRHSPAVGTNPGGAWEVVSDEGDSRVRFLQYESHIGHTPMIRGIEQFWNEIRDLCRTLADAGHQDWAGDLANAFSAQPGVEQMAHARWVLVRLGRTSVSTELKMTEEVRGLIEFTDAIGERNQIQWKDPPA